MTIRQHYRLNELCRQFYELLSYSRFLHSKTKTSWMMIPCIPYVEFISIMKFMIFVCLCDMWVDDKDIWACYTHTHTLTISIECDKIVNKDILLPVWIEKCDNPTCQFLNLFFYKWLLSNHIIGCIRCESFAIFSALIFRHVNSTEAEEEKKMNALAINWQLIWWSLTYENSLPIVMCPMMTCVFRVIVPTNPSKFLIFCARFWLVEFD